MLLKIAYHALVSNILPTYLRSIKINQHYAPRNKLISTLPILLSCFNHISYLFMNISSLSSTSTA